jgi:hypothetical protein
MNHKRYQALIIIAFAWVLWLGEKTETLNRSETSLVKMDLFVGQEDCEGALAKNYSKYKSRGFKAGPFRNTLARKIKNGETKVKTLWFICNEGIEKPDADRIVMIERLRKSLEIMKKRKAREQVKQRSK